MNILGLILLAFVNELIGIVIGMELWEILDEYAEIEPQEGSDKE